MAKIFYLAYKTRIRLYSLASNGWKSLILFKYSISNKLLYHTYFWMCIIIYFKGLFMTDVSVCNINYKYYKSINRNIINV